VSPAAWTPEDVPALRGRRALVTGVTSGLGEHVATALARAGAEVVLAGRDPGKLEATHRLVAEQAPDATVHPLRLDLADLSSVREAAQEVADLGPLAILVNNAGVMGTPHERTVDGFELQIGTNHLGHFALTGLLLPALLAAAEPRVVTVSSLMARSVRGVPTGDLRARRGRYRKWTAYGGSKLANLLFTVELDRRSRAGGLPLTAVAAHPGYAATNLVDSGVNRGGRRPDGAILLAVTRLVGQSAHAGAQPLVMAATAPGLQGGAYVGPGGPFELNGRPQLVSMPGAAHDEQLASRLWEASERATGVAYP
jgi:NAD(P)-dependent dehydrogenase (short-subunit alcohol dehydrogenase family)